MHVKCPQRDEKGTNKESRCRGYTDQGRRMATIKRADAEAKRPVDREEKGNNKESRSRGC